MKTREELRQLHNAIQAETDFEKREALQREFQQAIDEIKDAIADLDSFRKYKATLN